MSDAPHLDEAAQEAILASMPSYQREARRTGVPSLGVGLIYPIDEKDITIQDFELPAWYPRAYGLDTGWNWTAALWVALDRETDVLYIYAAYKRAQAEPPSHADAIKSRGSWIPGVGDCADINRYDGTQFLKIYRDLGLLLELPDKRSVEANVHAVYTRMVTGRLKIFRSLEIVFDEQRMYRREETPDGLSAKIVRQNDHLMACLQYLVKSGIRVMKTKVEAEPDRTPFLNARASAWT